MSLDLSVIVTTYNSARYLGGLLDSIEELPADEKPLETVVVDNASADESASIADSRDGVKLIRSPRNMGLARANNTGARAAAGSHLLFLNPDTRLLPGALPVLMDFSRTHPAAMILGPAMTGTEGNPQSTARTYPGLLDILLRRTFLGRLPGADRRIRRHLYAYGTDRAVKVDWLVGAALWLTPAGREVIGLMPENYFLYFEDVEWCWQANHSGGEVWYVPDSVIRHVHRRESAGGSVKALGHHLASMLRFFSRHPSAITGSAGRGREA
jgi:GT2 family glycosyltransferase